VTQCHPDGVCGYGNPDADIMFVGIAPGADEWRNSKRPLTGPSGKLLDAILTACDLDRKDVFCTNLICWWKDLPTSDEIAACAPRLQAEISTVNPKIIVTLGKLACESLLGMPFKKAQGAIVKKDGHLYLSTYHPAAALHRASTAVEKELQIAAAAALCRDIRKLSDSQYAKEWLEPTYTTITNPHDAQIFLDSLPTDKPIAIDIETDYDKEYEKEHPFDHDITCIGIGYSDSHAFVLTQAAIQQELVWPDCQWVFHNGMFDTQEIARRFGVWLPIKQDTMLQSYSVDERGLKNGTGLHHKLKTLSREYCGADFYEEDEHKESLDALYEYNAKDVVYTYRLHQHLTSWQQAEGADRMYNELLLPAANVLAHSQYRGIHVNLDYMREVFRVFGAEYKQLQAELQRFNAETLGYPDFNVRSPKQVKMLLNFQGYPVEDTKKATLDDLLDQEDIPFIRMLRRHRTLDKLMTNYMADVHDQIKYDGRVHPHPILIGTVTGRLSYKAPAMQTLPKPKTVRDLGVVRKIFSTTNDDYILLEVDYAQIEAWIGAYFSEDDVLLADLTSGDWHSSVATGMFNKTPEQCVEYEWAHLRDAAKHINYGSMYGEEAQGLTRRPPTGIGCDLQTAREYLNRWRAHYPRFVAYQRGQQLEAQNQGYIETPFGRRRRFPLLVNDHQLRQAINYKIQSTAGDYTLSSAIRLYPQLEALDTHLLFIEHDAIYYEVAKRNFDEALALIRYEMESPPLPGLPSIHVEADAGPNLAELERVV
jgi:uracil-DNA glycosylase family 4